VLSDNRVHSLLWVPPHFEQGGHTTCTGYAELTDPVDYAVLGSYVGRVAGERVVAFRGINPSREDLKALGAALASTGAVALFFVEGVTPEWRLSDKPEVADVSQADLKKEADKLGGSCAQR